ncbi:hypothetical protein BASA62_008705 [Batrachochytrium salamandrivorans]|nr:hypothetical protein BASA62_008705 [Batrachochytrium salamandrivorans]
MVQAAMLPGLLYISLWTTVLRLATRADLPSLLTDIRRDVTDTHHHAFCATKPRPFFPPTIKPLYVRIEHTAGQIPVVVPFSNTTTGTTTTLLLTTAALLLLRTTALLATTTVRH